MFGDCVIRQPSTAVTAKQDKVIKLPSGPSESQQLERNRPEAVLPEDADPLIADVRIIRERTQAPERPVGAETSFDDAQALSR